jgi:hypothetical protein
MTALEILERELRKMDREMGFQREAIDQMEITLANMKLHFEHMIKERDELNKSLGKLRGLEEVCEAFETCECNKVCGE